MKIKLLIIVFLTSLFTYAQGEVGVTKGNLDVSLRGTLNYSIPIKLPPGINGVQPNISLEYNSQGGPGFAGLGWNLAGISTIERIPSTIFHDGNPDAVDGDQKDRLMLDGQRLLVKAVGSGGAGSYWGNNTTYTTENFSNIKVTSYNLSSNPLNTGSFKVEYPDGSFAWYGTPALTINKWCITYWQNAQGLRIKYNYYITNNNIIIKSIEYGSTGTDASINKIEFIPKSRTVGFQYFSNGLNILDDTVLSEIKITGNGSPYMNYVLGHDVTSNNYDRLISITKKTGDNTLSLNPTTFSYEQNQSSNPQTLSFVANSGIFGTTNSSAYSVVGDFNGDGELDVINPTGGMLVNNDVDCNVGIYSLNNHNVETIGFGSLILPNFSRYFILALTTLTSQEDGYKVMSKDTFGVIYKNTSTTKISIYSYESASNPMVLEYEKVIPTTIYPEEWQLEAFTGDFNGDGLTDLLTISKNGANAIMDIVDLDRRKTSNYTSSFTLNVGVTTNLQDFQYNGSTKFDVADITGDGKSDLIIYKGSPYNAIDIYSLENNMMTLQFTYNYPIPPMVGGPTSSYSGSSLYKYPIIIGDYNGDGKADLAIIKEKKVLYSTGTSFSEQLLHTSLTDIEGDQIPVYMPADFNNDGKTDILEFKRIYANNNVNVSGLQISLFSKPLTGGSIWQYSTLYSQSYYLGDSNLWTYRLNPLFVRKTGNNDELSEVAVIGASMKLSFYSNTNFLKNQSLLTSVVWGNGVEESISYASLTDGNGTYFKQPNLSYPYYSIKKADEWRVVSTVAKTFPGYYAQKDFTYYGATNNLEGLGFLGFSAISSTNWYIDESQAITTVRKFDIYKRGAETESVSIDGLVPSTYTFTSGNPFINRTLKYYNNETGPGTYEDPLLPNKIWNLKNTKTIVSDGLQGISTETTSTYNTYNNPLQVTVTSKTGTSPERTIVTGFEYDVPLAAPYIIDRPKRKTITSTLFPSNESFTSQESYTFSNNLMTAIKQKGQNTDELIIENGYDAYGNIISIKASGIGINPRIESYEYDTSHRFIIKKNHINGLVTNYSYNNSTGDLSSETTPSNTSYPLVTNYTYNKWGYMTKKLNYLGYGETYTYSNNNDGHKVTTVNDDGGGNFIQFDHVGREISKSIKDINDNYNVISIGYDLLGNLVYQSQPRLNGNIITAWNEKEYDKYGRLIREAALKSTSSQGKVKTYSYSGLTMTESESTTTKTYTKNSLGQIASVSQSPGAAISYSYFPGGAIKATNCSGAITTFTQDNWGRKATMTDASGGAFQYEYNILGELTKEKRIGKGENVYTLDDTGNLSIKTVKDASGVVKSKGTYTYDATTKLLSNILSEDFVNGNSSTFTFTYDNYRRPDIKTEITPQAKFEITTKYDGYGRRSKEFHKAVHIATGSTTTASFQRTYKNGYDYQFIDLDTNENVIYQVDNVNANGQITASTLGNGITTTSQFDIYGFPKKAIFNKNGSNFFTLDYTFDPISGNLLSRSNSLFAWTENLGYDANDRLLNYNSATATLQQAYNTNGTIKTNTIGTYAYSLLSRPYMISTITPGNPSPALTYYTNRNQDITYDTQDQATRISEQNNEIIDLDYNVFGDRSVMYFGGTQSTKLDRPYRMFYSTDHSMEMRSKTTGGSTPTTTFFIGGDAYTAPAIFWSNGSSQKYFFLHRDYQGSIIAITDEDGELVEKRLFDAWGEIIKYDYEGITTIPTTTLAMFINRGYTGHEHLQGTGLINMNGRLYNPKLHVFLQPDNNIQDSYNFQNFNRFGYALNNPTKYVDPSGEFWGLVLGYLAYSYVGTAQATGQANPLKWSGSNWANAALGAASTVLSYNLQSYTNSYIAGYNNNKMNTGAASNQQNSINTHTYTNDNAVRKFFDKLGNTWDRFADNVVETLHDFSTLTERMEGHDVVDDHYRFGSADLSVKITSEPVKGYVKQETTYGIYSTNEDNIGFYTSRVMQIGPSVKVSKPLDINFSPPITFGFKLNTNNPYSNPMIKNDNKMSVSGSVAPDLPFSLTYKYEQSLDSGAQNQSIGIEWPPSIKVQAGVINTTTILVKSKTYDLRAIFN